MTVYISEPKSFMSADLLTKNTSREELRKSFQRLLDDGKDLNKLELLNSKFKPLLVKAVQKTSTCIMVYFPDPKRIHERFFFLEGSLS